MTDKHNRLLKAAIVPVTIAVALSTAIWWAHNRFIDIEVRLSRTEIELTQTLAALNSVETQIKQTERQANALITEQVALRNQLVAVQRNGYDHEKMLSSIFTIQKSGDSIVSFRKQDKAQAISIQVGP